MADPRFDEYRDTEVLVTVRARFMMSASGWHDFKQGDAFKNENGFSVPDSMVLDMVECPPDPDPVWEDGDLVFATYMVRTADSSSEIADYFEYDAEGATRPWRWIRQDTMVARDRLIDIKPIARGGEPWVEE